MKKEVYFVRHGESEGNVGEPPVYKPDADLELTQKGREQSRFIAERVASLPFDSLVVSPYVRTRDTAAMIEKTTGKKAEYSDLIVERILPSSIVGKSRDDESVDALVADWVDSFFVANTRVEDGENFEDITERAKQALRLFEQRPDERILAVSHGFFLRVVLSVVMFGESLTPKELKQFIAATSTTNTGITMISYTTEVHAHDVDPDRPRWRIKIFNDHAHLG